MTLFPQFQTFSPFLYEIPRLLHEMPQEGKKEGQENSYRPSVVTFSYPSLHLHLQYGQFLFCRRMSYFWYPRKWRQSGFGHT